MGNIHRFIQLVATATISHTAIVWLLAILALTYGSQWSAETSELYFQFASAAIIVGIAVWMLVTAYRSQRATRGGDGA